ncbi:general stress protein [Sphingobium sp. AS12]|uniref:general stress protein n=1 Tax=Sphingobium sp. AS12 TaxID=2849495 RepID=UPI001C317EB7|nr:general stress protein [Sphingobium sp. AS12]MBV2149169.1 general stress protein [Sphingobium sp. AS12]
MSDNNRSGIGHDDPNRGPLDRAANALDGRDDPNRGPLDRAANALHGHDDPNRGPLDRAANAISGGSDGVNAAIGGSPSSTSGTYDATVVSAVFDTQEEAERAVSELRNAGVSDSALSVIAQKRGTLTTRDVDGEITDEEHTNVLRGILGGGALGAGLGVLALAIPGVGPLAALGAIAASAVPEALAIGAVAGAVVGTFNEVLLKHGVSEEDAAYYGDQMKSGGVLVTVTGQGSAGERARDILYRNGGHSSSRAKAAAI